MSDLFRRVPTNDEKQWLSEQWGGIPWTRCLLGMVTMFVVGMVFGMALSI